MTVFHKLSIIAASALISAAFLALFLSDESPQAPAWQTQVNETNRPVPSNTNRIDSPTSYHSVDTNMTTTKLETTAPKSLFEAASELSNSALQAASQQKEDEITQVMDKIKRNGNMAHISDDVLIEMLQNSPNVIEQFLMDDDDKRIIDNYFDFDYQRFWTFGPLGFDGNISDEFHNAYPIFIPDYVSEQIPDNEWAYIDQAKAKGGIDLIEHDINLEEFVKRHPQAVIEKRLFHELNYYSLQSFLFERNPYADYQTLPVADSKLNHCIKSEIIDTPVLQLLVELRCYDEIYDLNGIERIKSLSTLDLRLSRITDIYPLTELSELEHLSLEGGDWLDFNLLQGMSKLKSLTLKNNTVHNSHAISQLDNLQQLGLIDIKDFDFQQLKQLPQLKALGVESLQNIHQQAINNFEQLENLEVLYLAYGNIIDSQNLAKLSNLKHLTLDYVTLDNLDFISKLENLEYLVINGGEFTSIPDLSNNRKLKMLSLTDGKLTSANALSTHFRACIFRFE